VDSRAGNDRSTTRGNGHAHGIHSARDHDRGSRHSSPPSARAANDRPMWTSHHSSPAQSSKSQVRQPDRWQPEHAENSARSGPLYHARHHHAGHFGRSKQFAAQITSASKTSSARPPSSFPPPRRPPPPGLFGGGTDNIAFLLGQAAATAPNAQATQMTAVFWIETVEEIILVPPLQGGWPALR
jgi:hypothetical protein